MIMRKLLLLVALQRDRLHMPPAASAKFKRVAGDRRATRTPRHLIGPNLFQDLLSRSRCRSNRHRPPERYMSRPVARMPDFVDTRRCSLQAISRLQFREALIV